MRRLTRTGSPGERFDEEDGSSSGDMGERWATVQRDDIATTTGEETGFEDGGDTATP
jgi:hypothetical protein